MDLEKMRKEIDDIDLDILRLIAKRFEIAVRTRRLKNDTKDIERETFVKNNVKNNAKFLLRPDFCEKLFSQIIDESRLIQDSNEKLIGFVGVHGSLSEQAIQDQLCTSIPCDSFKEIFSGVQNGILDSGIVPFDRIIEESTENSFVEFLNSGLFICNQLEVKSNYCLMTLPSTDYRDIKIVYSHPDILSRAQDFMLRTKLQTVPYHGSAQAALMLSTQKLQACAVIAPANCAAVYNLSIVKEDVLSDIFTTSRYLEVKKEINNDGANAAIYLEICQTSGSLNNVLKEFTDHNINLTKLESLATTNSNIATFFVEFCIQGIPCSLDDLIQKIKKVSKTSKMLGIF